MIKEIDKLAWLHVEDGKVLAARSKGRDIVYIPGGKRELGESDEQALIREIREELSIDLISDTVEYIESFVAQADGKPEGIHVRVSCYRAAFEGLIKASAEIEEVLWIDSSDRARCSAAGHLILDWLLERHLIR